MKKPEHPPIAESQLIDWHNLENNQIVSPAPTCKLNILISKNIHLSHASIPHMHSK